MRQFIFYTTDGFTVAPDMTELENCQILAFELAPDLHAAWNSFAISHSDFLQMGFRNIVCRELV